MVNIMREYPAKFPIHKGKMGAAQFSPIPPTWEEKSGPNGPACKVVRTGAIYLEMAPFLAKNANGDDTFDWQNRKNDFSFGLNDIAQILGAMNSGTELRLTHDDPAKLKSLSLTPGKDQYVGTWKIFLKVTLKADNSSNITNIALSAGEAEILYNILRVWPLYALGWI